MSQCIQCNNEASKRCTRCGGTLYCSKECQESHWPKHKKSCIPPVMKGITLNCPKDRRLGHPMFEPVDITPEHPIHQLGQIAPVSKLYKLPIIVYRHVQTPWFERSDTSDDGMLDNQPATYLMIESSDGMASMEWQRQVGSVTVMRKDGKPLTEATLETLWMFHDHLLDLFGDDPNIARRKMNRRAFDEFCEHYKEEQVENNRGEFDFQNMTIPL